MRTATGRNIILSLKLGNLQRREASKNFTTLEFFPTSFVVISLCLSRKKLKVTLRTTRAQKVSCRATRQKFQCVMERHKQIQ